MLKKNQDGVVSISEELRIDAKGEYFEDMFLIVSDLCYPRFVDIVSKNKLIVVVLLLITSGHNKALNGLNFPCLHLKWQFILDYFHLIGI